MKAPSCDSYILPQKFFSFTDIYPNTQGYARYEIGQRDIPTTILIKLADYYGVSVDYLLGRTNKKSMR